MIEPISLSAAFFVGLLGGAHCIGMCGGIVNALTFSMRADTHQTRRASAIILTYNLGRLFSYTLAGVVAGALGWAMGEAIGSLVVALRIVAGLLMVAMGFYIAGWWMGLRRLEHAGGHIWRHFEPLGKRLMPVHTWNQAAVLGALWGWLPCGMVYSALSWSATTGNVLQGGLTMLSFGLGTLPVMLMTGALSVKFKMIIQRVAIRGTMGAMIILFGLWTLVTAFQSSEAHRHSGHHVSSMAMR